jgi:hypothetical protein
VLRKDKSIIIVEIKYGKGNKVEEMIKEALYK